MTCRARVLTGCVRRAATHVIGTNIVAIAGRIDFPDEFTDEVRVYDTLMNQWHAMVFFALACEPSILWGPCPWLI